MNKSKYEVIDDNYATPSHIYKPLMDEFNFDFDPCPYNESPITPETDGLLKEWGRSNFINPPYSRGIKDSFVKKAIEEAKKGKTCVLLIPASTGTNLFHDFIKPNAKEIRFLRGRIKFDKKCKETGVFKPSKDSARFDSMIVVF